MANYKIAETNLTPRERGFTNHPNDKGGPTKNGITLATWREYGYDKDGDGDIDVEDLKLMSSEDQSKVFKEIFWDSIGGDKIKNQQIAEIIFDFAVNSGIYRAGKFVQFLINKHFGGNLDIDGKIGRKTLSAINKLSAKKMFEVFKLYRINYYKYIANTEIESMPEDSTNFFKNILNVSPRNKNKSFIRGWLNRINEIEWKEKAAIGVAGVAVPVVLFLLARWLINNLSK